jgi:hypothetical protein
MPNISPYINAGVVCFLLSLFMITVGNFAIAKETTTLKSSKYEKVMNSMNVLDNEALLDVLKSAGYANAKLGQRRDLTFQKQQKNSENQHPASKETFEVTTEEEDFPHEFTFGHSCQSVDLKMTTKHMQDKGATVVVVNNDDGSENINPNSVLLETNEKVVLNKRVLRKVNSQAQGKLNGKMGEIMQLSNSLSSGAQINLEKGMQGNAKSSTDLDCECKPYECHCHKQCFCRLSTDPFSGTHFPPEANCPVCPVCSTPGKDAPQKGKGKTKNIEQDFKCTCNMDGVGGPGISEGGYMECDCKIADCTCSKECQCKKQGSLFDFKEKDGKTIKIDEKTIKHGEDVHNRNMQQEQKQQQNSKNTNKNGQRFKETKIQEASTMNSKNIKKNYTEKEKEKKEQKIEDVVYG